MRWAIRRYAGRFVRRLASPAAQANAAIRRARASGRMGLPPEGVAGRTRFEVGGGLGALDTVIPAVAWSFSPPTPLPGVEFGSGWSDVQTSAVFDSGPTAVALA